MKYRVIWSQLAISILFVLASGYGFSGKGFPASPSMLADSPPPVYSFGAAYDSDRNKLVIFGGYNSGSYSGETWEWDGAAWACVSKTGPSARNSPAMVYDARRKKVVLFGGDTRSGQFGDTWEWDAREWKQAAISGPPPRSLHRLAYDRMSGNVVLFGGRAGDSILGDTWQWDGSRWTQFAGPCPPARFLHGMAYDSARRKVVVFGGSLAKGQPTAADLLGDTWEWDGSRWTKLDAPGPSARDHLTMDYDAARQRIVLSCGSDTSDAGVLGDTWEWDGKTWKKAATSGVTPRAGHYIVYSPSLTSTLLFGGFTPQGGPTTEIWRWDGNRWTRIR